MHSPKKLFLPTLLMLDIEVLGDRKNFIGNQRTVTEKLSPRVQEYAMYNSRGKSTTAELFEAIQLCIERMLQRRQTEIPHLSTIPYLHYFLSAHCL